jgi:hypothetical protein
MPPEEPRWIVGPPAPGEVNIQIAVDSRAQLTPELHQALEKLVLALQQDEVEGYRRPEPCPDKVVVCKPQGTCLPKITSPCATFQTCRIG